MSTVLVATTLSGVIGGLASGIVVAATSFPLLALAGGVLSLAVLPAIAATARTR